MQYLRLFYFMIIQTLIEMKRLYQPTQNIAELDPALPGTNGQGGIKFKIFARSNILVIGASGSGKTTTVLDIIKNRLVEGTQTKIL